MLIRGQFQLADDQKRVCLSQNLNKKFQLGLHKFLSIFFILDLVIIASDHKSWEEKIHRFVNMTLTFGSGNY